MCIISLHLQHHPLYKLILIANRDEAYARPTEAVHFWKDEPEILAGRDLKVLGTWLGITKQGRIAALTNFRDPNSEQTNKQTRGDIVTSFLKSNQSAEHFLDDLQTKRSHYNGFNLILGSVDQLFYYSKQENKPIALSTGTYSVSNAALNTPWPKVEKARNRLQQYVTTHPTITVEALLDQLHDDKIADDSLLPQTGVELSLERLLSPIFIRTEHYGTRSSTVLLVTHDNQVNFTERTFDKGTFQKDTHMTFQIENN